jgi:hypothetical protein
METSMRILGPVLVVLALACSPHGMRLQESEPAAEQASASPPVMCQEPMRLPNPDALELPPLPKGANFVPLNTSGYNYTFQERYPVPPPSSAAPAGPRR